GRRPAVRRAGAGCQRGVRAHGRTRGAGSVRLSRNVAAARLRPSISREHTMRNHLLRGAAARGALLTLALAVAGCGSKSVDDNAPLAYVPADTPWLFANVEPLPEATRDQFARQTKALWPIVIGIFDSAVADLDRTAATRSADDADHDDDLDEDDADAATDAAASTAKENAAIAARTLRAVLDEIRTRDTPEKWEELGVRRDAHI